MEQVSLVCKNYFSGFEEIVNFENNNNETNALACLKIISYITIVIPLIFAITYAAASLCDRVSEKENLSPLDNAVNNFALNNLSINSNSQPVGGFANSAYYCYIATSLQVLRHIPLVTKHLDPDFKLIQKIDEPDDIFKIRQKIKLKINEMLKMTETGETAPASELEELRELLACYNPKIHHKGGGSSLHCMPDLLNIIGISADGYDSELSYYLQDDNMEAPYDLIHRMDEDDQEEHLTFRPSIVGIHCNCAPDQYFEYNPEDFITIPARGDTPACTYTLIAIMCSVGHAYTYIRNYNDSKTPFIKYDDGQVSKEVNYPSKYNTKAFIYTKMPQQ